MYIYYIYAVDFHTNVRDLQQLLMYSKQEKFTLVASSRSSSSISSKIIINLYCYCISRFNNKIPKFKYSTKMSVGIKNLSSLNLLLASKVWLVFRIY